MTEYKRVVCIFCESIKEFEYNDKFEDVDDLIEKSGWISFGRKKHICSICSKGILAVVNKGKQLEKIKGKL